MRPMNRLNSSDSRLPPLPAAIQNGLLSVASQELSLPQIRAEPQPFPSKRNRIVINQNLTRSPIHHRNRCF
jgi:hypothetical protein